MVFQWLVLWQGLEFTSHPCQFLCAVLHVVQICAWIYDVYYILHFTKEKNKENWWTLSASVVIRFVR